MFGLCWIVSIKAFHDSYANILKFANEMFDNVKTIHNECCLWKTFLYQRDIRNIHVHHDDLYLQSCASFKLHKNKKRGPFSSVKEEYPVIFQYRLPYKKRNRVRLDFSVNEIHPLINNAVTNFFLLLSWGSEKRVSEKRSIKKHCNA